MLRIRVKNGTTVFEHAELARRDVRAKIAEHVALYGIEHAPTGRKDHRGHVIVKKQNVPTDRWVFLWVDNPGESNETETPLDLVGNPTGPAVPVPAVT